MERASYGRLDVVATQSPRDIITGMRILVVGAGGYVGGRLVSRLLAAGHDLTLLSQDPKALAHRFPEARVAPLDPADLAGLAVVASSVEAVYALPETIVRHGSPAWFNRLEMASRLGAAVGAAQRSDGALRRIIHLGDLGDAPRDSISAQPGAWSAVGLALAASGAAVLDLRASLIFGSGSAPFEMVRHLTDRVNIMTTPRWMEALAQPIAIRDVLAILAASLEHERTGVVEIGGADVLTFADMLLIYARVRGLRRVRLPLPIATPWASDLVVSLVSPLPAGVVRSIIERLRNGVVVRDGGSAAEFGVTPVGYETAIRRALERIAANQVETTWFDSLGSSLEGAGLDGGTEPLDVTQTRRPMLSHRRTLEITASPERVFAEVERVGGAAGWPAANILWRIRGLLDRMVGGIGMRLGRRDRERLRVGDALDFWRVETVDRPRVLRLRAAMRIPGRAWLQYEVEPISVGSRLTQTAYFDPHGVTGYAYWYLLLPVHDPIFRATMRVLARRATL